MLKQWFIIVLSFMLSILFLTACGGSPPPEAAPPVVAESSPTVQTVAPADTPLPEPTATTLVVEQVEEVQEAAPVEPTSEPTVEVVEAPAQEEVAAVEDVVESVETIRTFVIVSQESNASYIVGEEFFGGALDRFGIEQGLVDTIGSTPEVNGQMQLNLSDLAAPVVSSQFTVDLSTLSSDQSRRDNRIKTHNLESGRFPLATFTITSLENVPQAYTEGQEVAFSAMGDITIREITQLATFEINATLSGDTITGVALTQLKMTDFGFNPPNFANVFNVADEFAAEVAFTFKEQ